MSIARERGVTALPAGRALELWLDPARWPTFVDGFGALGRVHDRWPEPGATAVWKSRPGGRGTVTAKVVDLEPPRRVVIDVIDDKLSGRETITFEDDPAGSIVLVELDYRLSESTPLMVLADKIFIRRSQRDSIRRTLERFAIEAAEEAGLPDGHR